jgi:hypothetical protein
MRCLPRPFLALMVAAGCAATRAPGALDQATGPDSADTGEKLDLPALMARELPAPLPRARVSLFKGKVTTEVEAAGPTKLEDGTLAENGKAADLTVPLGTGADMSCYVYPEATDPASTVADILQKLGKIVRIERVRLSHVEVVGDHPAMYFDADYSSTGETGREVGLFKIMLYASRETPVFCQHDEVGYRASFRRITQGLVKSMKAPSDGPPPRFVEVHILRMGDQPVGFEQRATRRAENGNVQTWQKTALFLPRSPRELAFSDHLQSDFFDTDGNLRFLSAVEVEDDQLTTEIEAERATDGRYLVKGKHGGEEVKGAFRSKGKRGPLTWSASSRELRKLLAGKVRELSLEEYHPGFDPIRPMQVVYRRGEGRAVTMTFGPIEVKATLDENGLIEQAEVPMGDLRVTSRRAFLRGTP